MSRKQTHPQYARDCKIIPVQDLASRYRLPPLLSTREDGRQIASHLDSIFQRFGPPLLLKKDNGSPYNNQYVDELLLKWNVVPLNSPPGYPQYNAAIKKGIRDLKENLQERIDDEPRVDAATATPRGHHPPAQPSKLAQLAWSDPERVLSQQGLPLEGHHP